MLVVDTSVVLALRGLVWSGALSLDRAQDVRGEFKELAITRDGHQPLADRIWELRDNLTAYDAAFFALAEALGVPLVTCDARLARAPGVTAELYPRS